jgi:hypothetical protein
VSPTAASWEPERVQWLVVSLVASVVLTVLLNVAVRLWPGAADRSAERITDWADHQAPPPSDDDQGRVRVIVPWKAMLIASVVLTVLLNVVVRL